MTPNPIPQFALLEEHALTPIAALRHMMRQAVYDEAAEAGHAITSTVAGIQRNV